MQSLKYLLSLPLFICCQAAFAGPWFTGPLLAPSGKTTPKGYADLEVYGFDTKNTGIFNRHWKLIHGPSSRTYQVNPLLTYGLSDIMDFQFILPYAINHNQRKSSSNAGDIAALLGLQLLKQGDSILRPDLRLTVRQVFPTGRYNHLDPLKAGTDATGAGSYQTTLGLNLQLLTQFSAVNYLRTRLVLTHLQASSVHVRGLNTYGGEPSTNGRVSPGSLNGIDLSGEFTVTRNWVAVMEGYYFYRNKTGFSGFPGDAVNGKIPVLGQGVAEELSLAPAIEYNFNSHIGIIGGAWFAVRGKNSPDFISAVVALNAYWQVD